MSDLDAAYLAILATTWMVTAGAVPRLWRDVRSGDEVRHTSKLHHAIMVAIAYVIVCGFFHSVITGGYHMLFWLIEG